MNKSRFKQQQGMTLIEIMIALVLGIFLIAGVLEIFLGSKQSNRMLENLSRLQENGRYAMDFMSRDIREAGLREVCFEREIPTAITGTNDDGLNGSDSVTTQISEDDCPLSSSVLTTIPTVYSVTAGTSGEPALWRSIDGTNQELIEGIENLQILYGEDIDNDYTPDYYLAAGSAGLNMNQVVSVQITLTVRSLEDNLTGIGDGRLRRIFSSTIAVRNRLL